ncbi:MAG: hypothetical protein K2X77_09380 [Candidatus Obscuribacterales bacterium]|jgi:hypothetical protein|nr:hypothetical protein [Candidatus Obscuribacterales bacterium]
MNQRPDQNDPNQISEPALHRLVLEQSVGSGASWFYWIGALSLINSILGYTNMTVSFPVGLGVTQLVDAVALTAKSTTASILAASIDAIIAGIFCAFGYFSRTMNWLFILGMALYALDAAILGVVTSMIGKFDWMSVGFHVFALYCIFRGYQSSRELNAVKHLGSGTNRPD